MKIFLLGSRDCEQSAQIFGDLTFLDLRWDCNRLLVIQFCSDFLNKNNGIFVLGVVFFFRQVSTF